MNLPVPHGKTLYLKLFFIHKYLDGVPLERYYFDCGAALGRIHELSKRFKPVHPRYDFFEKFNRERFNALIPDSLEPLRAALSELVDELRRTERTPENFGTVHFDFSDGNYMIDYSTGKITAFDFDNACRCWYMYDLANLWAHGVGWIQWEPDAEKRRAFMDAYFAEIVRGYRSETAVADAELARLPLFLRAEQMENIVDEFEIAHNAGEEAEIDETMAYNIKCVTEKLPFNGFFDDIFSPDSPFELEETSDER